MKTLRFLIALSGASLLLAGYAFAGDKDDANAKDKPKDQAACTCGKDPCTCCKDKDAKACGTDKDTCCGAKSTKDDQKKDETKDDTKTP
jgi:hypothetical protein